ncbi:MAG TPA: RimK family alpha-L-glutamate ligase [Candidatus Nanoarchaeia archaeon]|nr:RimK family alpha-L-glutamate ligase [Candidatus Nanoarchaeia archaeon]
MKAAIISLGSVSSQWTATAMKKYFDTVDSISLKEIDAKLGPDAGVYRDGELLPHYDCMYMKGSFRYANLLQAISGLLEGRCYMPLKRNAFTLIHNKLLTHLELQRHHIPMPRTYIVAGTMEAKKLLEAFHYPIIMKFPEGTQGKGVMIADSRSSASSVLDAIGALKQPFIIQEYIDGGDVDIRAFVVGDTVVASMQRVANKNEGRANIHAGGTAKAYVLEPEEKRIAVLTAKALGADICGVDMLRGAKGPLVIEANASPGLQGITAATKIDVADKIAKFMYDETNKFFGTKKKDEAKKVLENNDEIITQLKFKGDSILLPSIVTKMANFSEDAEYSIKMEKGNLVISKFDVGGK